MPTRLQPTAAMPGRPDIARPRPARMTSGRAAAWLAALLWACAGQAAELRLEPAPRTLIGVGQAITVFAAFKAQPSDPYPVYPAANTVTWSSSRPDCASVSTQGLVTGRTECDAVITARYQGLSSRLTVRVSGQWAERRVAVPGQGQRRYSVYRPPAVGTSPPALVAMHGGGGSALIQASTSQLVESAQQRGVVAAFLEGTGLVQTFNAGACCGTAQSRGTDDVAYVRRVLDDLIERDGIDPERVLATGFSNGGMMAHRLACEAADRFSAVAAVGGGSGEFDNAGRRYYPCQPARPIPVIHFHATNDRNYPIGGGPGDGLSRTDFYAIDATIADWRRRNNVRDDARRERVGASTVCTHHEQPLDAGRPSAPVALCTSDPPDVYDAVNRIVFGGGHSWPGGVRSPSPESDVPIADADANALIWQFVGPR